ncbi:MAG: sulfotransferase [Sphingomonadales bacterium]
MKQPLPTKITNLLASLKGALAERNRAEMNRVVDQLLLADAPLGEQWRQLAELMRVSGELTLANRAMGAFVTAAGRTPAALYAKVVLLTQTGRQRDAHELLTSLPGDIPERAGHAYVLGNIAMTLGRVDEARDHLRTALKHRPGWGPAWLTLATTVNLAKDPIGEQLLADGAVAERQAPAELARYCYALGKLHADRREHDAAFAAFARGAQLLRKETPYSRNGNAANSEQAMRGYPDGFFDRMRAQAKRDTSRPIFVTGLPRSGTTLVEHILASHSDVLDGGELNIVQHLAVAAKGVSGNHIDQYLAGGGSVDELGALYLHLLAERYPGAGRVVDKTIDVSRCFGLIAAALPDAPLIWMKRDPLDSAWSCFRTFFIHGVGWSYDLSDIADHFRLQDAQMAFWKDRLGDRLLIVPYNDLIDAPEDWTRKLLAHCGLGEEAAVHSSHKTERVVATASAMQVRRPINRDGLGVAKPYREYLKPFVESYFN